MKEVEEGMPNFWVFNIGTARQAPPEDWLAAWSHHTGQMWFPPTKRPTGVSAGDRAVIHGSGSRGFLAVVEVISTEPEPNPTEDDEGRHRWPWILRYRLLLAIRADAHAPSLERVDWPNPKSLRRQSHVRIDREMYERVCGALLEAATNAISVP